MNVDHTKITIPLECNGKKYHITVQIENPGSKPEDRIYMATGEGFKDLASTFKVGFGTTIEEAVMKFIDVFDQPEQLFEMIDDSENPGLQMFRPINP